ncbi:MAG: type II toxin-antitoxin system VapC family toxin [Phycisphaerae bacterium]|nr:type II toxin-antitoxin system VapC family toxin [Phycisphaerae bacterium]
MKRLVVDASVVVKLYFEEEHSDAAEKQLARAEELLAPDLLWVEVANVIWKRQRRGDLTQEAAAGILSQAMRLPIQVYEASELLPDALDLALRFDRTVYDSLYLALAVKTKTVMVSADQRLVRALADGPLKKHILWVGA